MYGIRSTHTKRNPGYHSDQGYGWCVSALGCSDIIGAVVRLLGISMAKDSVDLDPTNASSTPASPISTKGKATVGGYPIFEKWMRATRPNESYPIWDDWV